MREEGGVFSDGKEGSGGAVVLEGPVDWWYFFLSEGRLWYLFVWWTRAGVE